MPPQGRTPQERWSWRVVDVAGIGIHIHATFPLILLLVAAAAWYMEGGLRAVAEGVVFVLVLFLCVVLHELGHALTARRFGIRTRSITLYPIGGVSRMERMPKEPSRELAIAVAGPVVNIVIAVLLLPVLILTSGWDWQAAVALDAPFVAKLMSVNLLLAVFNLLPAFPMDGGRVLRAALTPWKGRLKATEAAGLVGRVVAVLFVAFGLLTAHVILVLIGVFVFFGAGQEAGAARLEASLEGKTVARAMVTRFRSLRPEERLGDLARSLASGFQHDFPVVEDGGGVLGVLGRQELLTRLAELGPDATAAQAMRGDCGTTRSDESLARALERMREQDCTLLPVVRDGRLEGILTRDNVFEVARAEEILRLRGNRGSNAPAPRA